MPSILPPERPTQLSEQPHPSAKYCPACGQPATAEGQQHQADRDPVGVATVFYVCDAAHIWSLRWFVGVPA
jgi:hypothetical protein